MIKRNSFLCFAFIHNVTLRIKEFRGKTSTPHGPKRLGQPPPCKAKHARLAAFDKIGNVFSLMYSQMIAKQFRQLNVYCRHLYFMKTGHDINCCVFKYRECITNQGFAETLQVISFKNELYFLHRRC